MTKVLPILVAAGLIVMALLVQRRRSRRKRGALTRIRESIEGVLDDAESRSEELTKRAGKLKGEAKRRMQEQAHELDIKQRELRGRLDEIKTDATRLLERARP